MEAMVAATASYPRTLTACSVSTSKASCGVLYVPAAMTQYPAGANGKKRSQKLYRKKIRWHGESSGVHVPGLGLGHLSCQADDDEQPLANDEEDWPGLDFGSPVWDLLPMPFELEEEDNGPDSGRTEQQMRSMPLAAARVDDAVQGLGLQQPMEERQLAAQALWAHVRTTANFDADLPARIADLASRSGAVCLLVSLLPCHEVAAAEAAAGVLSSLAAVPAHRPAVLTAGALEEATGALLRTPLDPQVRQQLACLLLHLSADEATHPRIVASNLLPLLVSMLQSPTDREAAAGILANIARCPTAHTAMMEAGAIPELARILREEGDGVSKALRRAVRSAMVDLASGDAFQRVSMIEEDVVPVPLIGASAFQSLKPVLDSLPLLASATPPASSPSSQGQGEEDFESAYKLVGLRGEEIPELDEDIRREREGRARQLFLARMGALEEAAKEGEAAKEASSSSKTETEPKRERKRPPGIDVLPKWDAIPRLVLILSLTDTAAAAAAACAVAEVAMSEENRVMLRNAGVIPRLVQLLASGDEGPMEDAAHALERLAVSYSVRKSIDYHGAIGGLVAILRAPEAPPSLKEKAAGALLLLSKDAEETEAMVQAGAIPGLVEIIQAPDSTDEARREAEFLLEEISSLKADPRANIVASGGLPPLLQMLRSSPTPEEAERAANILENLAAEEASVVAMVAAGAVPALEAALTISEDPSTSTSAMWSSRGAAARVVSKLAAGEPIKGALAESKLSDLLSKLLMSSSAPLSIKDNASAALLQLERSTNPDGEARAEMLVTVGDLIPRLLQELGHESSNAVQERAAAQLRDLVTVGEGGYAEAIANARGIPPLVALLDRGSYACKESVLSVVYALALNDENHEELLLAGVVPPLEKIVRSGNPTWKLALFTLRLLPV